MIFHVNDSMSLLLKSRGIDTPDNVTPDFSYPIKRKQDPCGREYWTVSHFWGLDKSISPEQDLSMLEWDGNELNFNAKNDKSISKILKKTIAVMKAWGICLEEDYPATVFYLFASYDNGDQLESEPSVKSVTLRFWAERDGSKTEGFSDVENWDQPAVSVICNRPIP